MNRLPNLKQFLKGDTGAITYRNVEIEFIHGRKAIMTISKDGDVIETIVLSDYENQGEEVMHSLFRERGFEQLSDEDLKEKLETRDRKEKEEEMKKKKIIEERRAAMVAAAAEERKIRESEEELQRTSEL